MKSKMPLRPSNPKAYGQQRLSRIDHMTIHRRVSLAKAVIQESIRGGSGPGDVLELGCGYQGLNLQVLSGIFPLLNFSGVDVTVVQDHIPQVVMIAADITQWTPPQQYDVVLSLAVVEHLIEPLQHFGLIQRCLKPGGMALLTSPTPQNHSVWGVLSDLRLLHDLKNEHKLYLTRAGIELMAKNAGLDVIHYQTFQFGLNQWVTLRHQGES